MKQLAEGIKADATHARIANLGTRLFTLASFLADPPSAFTAEVKTKAIEVLLSLRKVFVVKVLDESELLAVEISREIETRLSDWDTVRESNRVLGYIRTNPEEADRLADLCDVLRSKISSSAKNWQTHLPKSFTAPRPNNYADIINKKLYDSVKLHTKCDHTDDRGCERHIRDPCVDTWLPTRLRLGGPSKSSEWAMFDIATSSLACGFWNQFRWVLSIHDEGVLEPNKKPPRVTFKVPSQKENDDSEDQYKVDYDDLANAVPRPPGYICQILNADESSLCIELQLVPQTGLVEREQPVLIEAMYPHGGVNLLEVFDTYFPLTVKDKITLSHIVAQSFWQLYASDMMQSVWTSETIWFMHEHDKDENGDRLDIVSGKLPINPYITFDFDTDQKKVAESPRWDGKRKSPHMFPHILALGALILDIGLGRSVGKPKYRCLMSREDMLLAVAAINTGIRRLEDTQWDGFTLHKSLFTAVIKYCLSYKDQRPQPGAKKATGTQEHKDSSSISDTSSPVFMRKKEVYENVVRPLAWLAGAFYEKTNDVTCAYNLPTPYLKKLQIRARGHDLPSTTESNNVLKDNDHYFQNFMNFNASIHELQENLNSSEKPRPLKIAILDTGYKSDMPCFQDRENQGKPLGKISWKDYTSSPPLHKGVDEDGHGTFMTQLAMNSAMLADIYVVRIARTRDKQEILQRKDNIKEAITWAGIKEKVDIISMSFGIESGDDSVREIHNAITIVNTERKGQVIFLAAASNDSSYQFDMFPARHPCVISIHATNEKGVFIFNPSTPDCILGTFSEGLKENAFTANEFNAKTTSRFHLVMY
ncbi:unnamed protein product [Clonostachys rhizophaga]|uniref:Peptidase S8/S53 domain-containing protein n=1 Tax=Clonostachys rhizophaga TaxID=160324 RepID=A0A9N9YM26_9HYPO|nr:unnamed protein product [Clonostachys rhizophaga]